MLKPLLQPSRDFTYPTHRGEGYWQTSDGNHASAGLAGAGALVGAPPWLKGLAPLPPEAGGTDSQAGAEKQEQ